ncbi:MAG: ABC transporter permease [Gammaproteobacteria bacterium]
MIVVIAGRELRSLFVSPLAWVVLGVVQFLFAWVMFGQLEAYLNVAARIAKLEAPPGVTDLVIAPAISNLAVVLMLVMPLLSMRLLAGERADGTLSLLVSAPVGHASIILGKYLGLMAFALLQIGLLMLAPLSLLLITNLDLGKLAAAVLGLVLLVSAYAAVGVFMSSITARPVVAAMGTLGVLLLLLLLDWAGQSGDSELFAYMGLNTHFQPFAKGLFDTADLAYFLLLDLFFLALAIRRLEVLRLRG